MPCDRGRYPDAIPGALTGALGQTRQLGDTALHPPGLYRIHMFVWFHVQIDLNGLQGAVRSSGYPCLPMPMIAAPAAFQVPWRGIDSQPSPRQLQDLARQAVWVWGQAFGLVGLEQVRQAVIDLAVSQSCFF